MKSRSWMKAFRSHLASDKFKGSEWACCKCYKVVPHGCCPDHPAVHSHSVRKDLIAVADVLRWLDTLEADNHEA